jgi:hypothetical protein
MNTFVNMFVCMCMVTFIRSFSSVFYGKPQKPSVLARQQVPFPAVFLVQDGS